MHFAPVVGEPLPKAPSYDSDDMARDFWRASFRGGRAYREGRDADGDPLLIQHESESGAAYKRRKKATTARDYVGPIINRYNAYVFQKDPTLPESDDPQWGALINDADGLGTPMVDYMRRRLRTAQVDRESYILVDSTAPKAVERTRAQAQADGDRVIWRPVDADRVVWWHRVQGDLAAAVYLDHIDGQPVAIYLDDKTRQVIRLRNDKNVLTVSAVEEPMPHGYDAMPLVPLQPSLDDIGSGSTESQASPIAEGQRAVYNLLSLLSEELYGNTYTQWVVTGVTPDEAKASGVEFGIKRMFCVPNPAASVSRIGSDPTQAQSLRDSIAQEEASIWRSAGVQAGDASVAESGIAKAFKHADLSAILSALAHATEVAWNRLIRLSFPGDAFPGSVQMPHDYEPSDLASDLAELRESLGLQGMPPVVRQHMIRRFVGRNLSLSEEEKDQFDAEVLTATRRPGDIGGGLPQFT